MIHFHYEDTSFRAKAVALQKAWLKKVAAQEGFSILEINYIFCSDIYLLQINKQHLDHHYYTDIITFDNSEKAKELEADIFISVDRVKENAKGFTQPFSTELSRVMVHGLLHLMGYKDKTKEQKAEMRKMEDQYLLLKNG